MNIKEIAEWDRLWDYPLTDDSVVIDVGGYRGDWSWELRRRFNCTLIIFEPIKEFFDHCEKRFHSLHDVVLVHAGLSNRHVELAMSKMEECSSLYADRSTVKNLTYRAGREQRENVIIHDVASVMDCYHEVALMNINAEGAEFDIIERLLSTERIQRVKNLQAEFHDFRLDAARREIAIGKQLERTHEVKFTTDVGWKAWRRKE